MKPEFEMFNILEKKLGSEDAVRFMDLMNAHIEEKINSKVDDPITKKSKMTSIWDEINELQRLISKRRMESFKWILIAYCAAIVFTVIVLSNSR